MVKNIERVITNVFPDRRPLFDRVRNANGFVGDGFVGVPMSTKDPRAILDRLFGKGQW
jgi:hypothetical protein